MADLQRKTANLLDSGSTTYTVLDVTITANNGYYTLNGQSSSGGGRNYHASKDIMLDSGRYVMKLIGTAEGVTPYIQNGTTIIGYNGYAFTLNEPTSIYLGFNFDNSKPYFDNVSFGVMLIQSSTAPTTFEPYGWVHSLRKLTTATETIQSGDTIYTDGTAISTYSIKGNTVQSGTPSPQNPVMPNGCGNKTANLFNLKEWAASITSVRGNGTLDVTGDVISVTSNELQDAYTLPYTNVTGVYKIPVTPSTQYRIQGSMSSSGSFIIFQNGTTATWTQFGAITTAADTTFLTVRFGVKSTEPLGSTATFENFMISEGTSLKDYEPWGYKIPMSSGGVTTPIYLNEPLMGIATADTLASSGTVTRAYKTVVLDSNTVIDSYTTLWGIAFVIRTFNVPMGAGSAMIDAVCTHYPITNRDNIWRTSGSTLVAMSYAGENNAFLISHPNYTTVQDFKNYVAEQYNAGTPITVVVAVTTPTTETVTAPSIPTNEGANSITVDTTVQPSEFTATWTGWHDSSVKEYGAAGANKFDYTTMASGITGYYLTSAGVETESNAWAITDYIPCNGQSFTLGKIGGNAPSICLYDSNKTFIVGQAYNTGGAGYKNDITVTALQNAKYIRFSYFIASPADDLSTIMLNEGTTALPYEPYEYGWV